MKVALISTEKSTAMQGIRTISSFLKQNGFETKLIFMPFRPPKQNWDD